MCPRSGFLVQGNIRMYPCPGFFGHGEVRVYRGTGVSRGVRRTTWERSLNLVDVSDIFYFFLLGGGEGGVRGAGKGRGRIFIENPRRGGLPGGWGPRGEGPGGCLRGIWGGGG